jgi:polysaccharide pyruvyl transferase WcaK-like protein
MRIHHFYPRTRNIGDHFVQRGIEQMIRAIKPNATFELFNVNSRGEDKVEYGLTAAAIERANREADLIIVGGSNLYEGGLRWRWGVHLDVSALKNLRVPLFLLGIGSGSNFASPLHRPSARAQNEIKLLNDYASFSGARDVITFDWLQQLGVSKAKLTGDPATFIFNRKPQPNREGHILITVPPRRFWSSRTQFVKVHALGRAMFKALVEIARSLVESGHQIVVACNDPVDVPIAKSLIENKLPGEVVCPETPEEYFKLLMAARAVISGRLHTAVVAFSLGVPFLLLDVDQRTRGFIETYQLERWAIGPSRFGIEAQLRLATEELLNGNTADSSMAAIEKRDQMSARAHHLLREAVEALS